MSSGDLFIGFEKEPESLEDFLVQEGYLPVRKEGSCVTYERKDDLDVTLYFETNPRPVEEEEVPDWKKAGFQVIAELGINYPLDNYEEAFRITDRVLETFRGILYEPNPEEYSKSEKEQKNLYKNA